jgi:hypothetical protein
MLAWLNGPLEVDATRQHSVRLRSARATVLNCVRNVGQARSIGAKKNALPALPEAHVYLPCYWQRRRGAASLQRVFTSFAGRADSQGLPPFRTQLTLASSPHCQSDGRSVSRDYEAFFQ